MMMIEADFLQF